MKLLLGLPIICSYPWAIGLALPAIAQTAAPVVPAAPLPTSASPTGDSRFKVVYPPPVHETTAKQIFLLGTAPLGGTVLVNGQPMVRSAAGHFASSFPLALGENRFVLRYGTEELSIKVTRKTVGPAVSNSLVPESLVPAVDILRQPGERICLGAIAPPNATVTASLGHQTITLRPQPVADLPENSGVLTGNFLAAAQPSGQSGQYGGCLIYDSAGNLGKPQYRLNGAAAVAAAGSVTIGARAQPEVVQVTAVVGVARSGPSTDYARLTPLPQGTQASVTGQEGEWLRLDYGAWIKRQETQTVVGAMPPQTWIRGITSRPAAGWTELVLPLQMPVPVSVQQTEGKFSLTLHHATSQSDTMKLVANPVVERMEWQQETPDRLNFQFLLKTRQQWGYKLRYEGNTLILSLKNPPVLMPGSRLKGVKILLDPGHGGPEDSGSVGLNGYPEKDVALMVTKLLRSRLQARGATVIISREGDIDLSPNDRAKLINQQEPTLAISLHYNALPDDGNALKTQGLAAFWYNPQAQNLAQFMHDYLTTRLQRPSYGIYWNNLALTRPSVAPAVLLELGFMTNPEEFEWVRDPAQQRLLADALADGVEAWVVRQSR
jgi:N-acetylmuramoyl-L-alanine amidase